MVYNVFLNQIRTTLQEQLGNDYTVTIQPVPKNNGTILDGVSIQPPGSHMAPTIYLNAYFEQHQQGMAFSDIISDILSLFYLNPAPTHILAEQIADLSQVKEKIMFRLVHTNSNEELLTQIPHISMLDLSVIFYLFLERSTTGQMTAVIHNEHLELWKIDLNQLMQIAFFNTPKYFPSQIKSMKEVLTEIARINLGDAFSEDLLENLLHSDQPPFPLHVLSNDAGIHGAGCMIYPDVLKNFADTMDSDLIILPSSIHEVLITPDCSELSYEELSEMVTNINQSEVPGEDQLSNQVYLYRRREDRLSIVSQSSDLTNHHTF